MWIAFVVGWIVGSASLYAYMILTAREPRHDECMECRLPECDECPYPAASKEAAARRAA